MSADEQTVADVVIIAAAATILRRRAAEAMAQLMDGPCCGIEEVDDGIVVAASLQLAADAVDRALAEVAAVEVRR